MTGRRNPENPSGGTVNPVTPKSESDPNSWAKSVLRGIEETSDAFTPLKSAAGAMCCILDNYEVRPTIGIPPNSRSLCLP